jgi:hypothetical protein
VLHKRFNQPVLQQLDWDDVHANTVPSNNSPIPLPSQAYQTTIDRYVPTVNQPCRCTCSHANACKPSRKRQGCRSNSSGCEQHVPASLESQRCHATFTCHRLHTTGHRQNCHDTQTPSHPHTWLSQSNLKADTIALSQPLSGHVLQSTRLNHFARKSCPLHCTALRKGCSRKRRLDG